MKTATIRRVTAGLVLALVLAAGAGVLAQIAFYQKIVLTGPCQLSAGSGTPEGAVIGSPCDLFLRTNGGAGTILYIKETGAATNTGWAAVPPAGTIPAASGGTGIASYAVGDLIYASAATTLAKLADVAAGSYLRSGGVTTAPVWSTLTLPNTIAQGEIPTATAANTVTALAVGTAGQYLRSGGAAANVTWATFQAGELYSAATAASPFAFALDTDTGTFEVLTDAAIVKGVETGVTVDAAGDTITSTTDGIFRIGFHVSFVTALAGTDRFEFKIYKEGVALENCMTVRDASSATDFGSASITCLTTGSANDTWDVRVNNATDGTDISVSKLNFNLTRIGG